MIANELNYDIEIKPINKNRWSGILDLFEDANLYQTWSYPFIHLNNPELEHVVLKRNDEIISAAQIVIVKTALLNAGFAYINNGPLWKLKGKVSDTDDFRAIIKVLYDEYVNKRRFFLRLFPRIPSEMSVPFNQILSEEGFRLNKSIRQYRTFLMNLNPPLDSLRKGLDQKWRNQLNKAEKNGLEIIEGTSEELFDIFSEVYKDMHQRKQFAESVDIEEFKMIQTDLEDKNKMRIAVCKCDGNFVSAAICGAHGNCGIYLLGATCGDGLNSKGSYLIQWKMIEWLKNNNYVYYDLGGINPESNPGTYHFKAGLSGKNGEDVTFIGQFDACTNYPSQIMIKSHDLLKHLKRKIKG